MRDRTSHFAKAFKVKSDEFYTLYEDIENEMNVYLDYNPNVFKDKVILLPCDDPTKSNFTKYFINNFDRLGLKRLISTGYAKDGTAHYVTGFEDLFGGPDNPDFLEKSKGKCLVLTQGDPIPDSDNITSWKYLDGDGDFRSPEITNFRDQSDIIITNPPFSLFREFMTWVVRGGGRQFAIIGPLHSVTYVGVFNMFKKGLLTYRALGAGVKYLTDTGSLTGVPSIWLTNIPFTRCPQPLTLRTMQENLDDPIHPIIQKYGYQKYDNYDAIEVPSVRVIPSDYDGLMGVPISFLCYWDPDRFEIVSSTDNGKHLKTRVYTQSESKQAYKAKFGVPGDYCLNSSAMVIREGLLEKMYQRFLIRKRYARTEKIES